MVAHMSAESEGTNAGSGGLVFNGHREQAMCPSCHTWEQARWSRTTPRHTPSTSSPHGVPALSADVSHKSHEHSGSHGDSHVSQIQGAADNVADGTWLGWGQRKAGAGKGSGHGVVFKGGAQGRELGKPVQIRDLKPKGSRTLEAKMRQGVPLTGKPEQRGSRSCPGPGMGAARGVAHMAAGRTGRPGLTWPVQDCAHGPPQEAAPSWSARANPGEVAHTPRPEARWESCLPVAAQARPQELGFPPWQLEAHPGPAGHRPGEASNRSGPCPAAALPETPSLVWAQKCSLSFQPHTNSENTVGRNTKMAICQPR